MSPRMTDSGAVKIGSKSGYARPGAANPDFARQGRRSARARSPAIMVDIKTCGEVVGKRDVITLRWGTHIFANRRYHPSHDISTESTVHTPPSTIGSSPTPTQQHDGGFILRLEFPITVQPRSQRANSAPIAPSLTAAPAPIIKEKKLLDLDQYAIWDAPSADAVRFVLAWMLKAKSIPRSQKPLPCSVLNPPPASLAVDDIRPYNPFLCELCSALLILRVRPTQIQARQDLMNNITSTVPTLAMLKHIHSLVPVDDSIMTRTINSYFDRVNAIPYLADEGEDESLDEDLEAQFRRMQKRRVGREFTDRRRGPKERKAGQ